MSRRPAGAEARGSLVPRETRDLRTLVAAVLVPVVGVGVVLGSTALWAHRLPGLVATHWSGFTPDAFGTLTQAVAPVAVIGGVLGLALCLLGALWDSPRSVRGMFLATGTWTVALFAVLHVETLLAQRDLADAASARLTWGGMAALVVVPLVLAVLAYRVPRELRPPVPVTEPVPAELPRADASTPAVVSDAIGQGARLRVDESGLVVRWLGARALDVPVDTVAGASVRTVDPLGEFGGWGLRLGFEGEVGFVVRRGPAVVLHRVGARDVVVTTARAEAAAARLNSAADVSRDGTGGRRADESTG